LDNTFEYSVVRVEPDIRRGERVNVGIVVFNGKTLDIRIVDTRKAAAIASQNWDAYVQIFASNLKELFKDGKSASDLVTLVEALGRQVNLTKTGWFNAKNVDEYELQVKRIIESLVAKPKVARRAKETSIASEIAAIFRSALMLSAPHEPLESGKVVRNFTVDSGAGLVADFALQNGYLHLATTVNLTSSNPHIGSSASKAITMDLAKKANDQAKAYCVYAVAPSRKPEVREHISLLGDYSDAIFNWHEPDEQRKFKKVFYDAYASNHPTRLEQRILQD
jgi:hypothetical protein